MNKQDLIDMKNLLERKSLTSSKSMKLRYSFDISSYNDLVCTLGLHEFEVKEPEVGNMTFLAQKIYCFLPEFEIIADTVINFYKDINFYCYLKRGYVRLSMDEKKELFSSFMKKFCLPALEIYKRLYNDDKIFFADLDKLCGQSFIMQQVNNYYMGVNGEYNNDLFEVETYIHELMHVYTHNFVRNYSFSAFENLFEGFYLETIPMFSELVFNDWLFENKLFENSVLYHKNLVDYFDLQYYKTMKYIAEMSKRDDAFITTDNVNYKVTGNNRLLMDDGVPFFQYREEMSEGYMNDFIYSMSLIDAYKLFEKYKNGEAPTKLINDYIISLQDKNKFFNDLEQGYNLSFMCNEIEKNNVKIKSKYPVTGYKI